MIFIIIMFFTIILHRYPLYGPYILKKCSSHLHDKFKNPFLISQTSKARVRQGLIWGMRISISPER